MNGLWIAFGFLSRVPTPVVAFTSAGLARSLFWFPAVGALLGGLWWAMFAGLSPWLSSSVLALVMVTFGVLFTGALHLDGVADTFDGFSASGAGPARALEAMKDSRIGAHGAVALGLVLLGKFVAFENLRGTDVGAICLGASVAARLVCALVVASIKPARPSGLGATFAGTEPALASDGAAPRSSRNGRGFALASVVWFTVPALSAGLFAGRWVALAVTAATVVCCALFLVRRCVKAFGGVTGDTHGAVIEVCETAALLAGAIAEGLL